MSARSVLLALSPWLVASLALLARQAAQPAAAGPTVAGVGTPLPDPPALLAALPTAGRWTMLAGESSLRLVERRGSALHVGLAVQLAGDLELDPDGRLADLDVEATLEPGAARELLGTLGEGRLTLRGTATPSIPAAVPGARAAQPRAWLTLDGRRRPLVLRAAWMPCGPARLRVQLEAGWEGGVRGDGDAPWELLTGARHSTLALDLVLARS